MIRPWIYLVPKEAWVLLIVVAAILMIIGFRKAAVCLTGTIVVMALLSPFIGAFMGALPTWMLIIMIVFSFLSLLRLIFGRGAADHLLGRLLYDIIILPFRLLGWLFRGPGRRI